MGMLVRCSSRCCAVSLEARKRGRELGLESTAFTWIGRDKYLWRLHLSLGFNLDTYYFVTSSSSQVPRRCSLCVLDAYFDSPDRTSRRSPHPCASRTVRSNLFRLPKTRMRIHIDIGFLPLYAYSHTAIPNRPKTYSLSRLITLILSLLYLSPTDNYTPHQPATQSP
jgi:hypothetical protein